MLKSLLYTETNNKSFNKCSQERECYNKGRNMSLKSFPSKDIIPKLLRNPENEYV